jgi:Dehydrogenases with different specificities (related to short-chain alcohol dehydrogenases)
MFDLTNRVAVVTGASSGLGVQFAEALIKQGADVAILARRKDKLEAVGGSLKKLGKRVLPLACDVTDENKIKQAVDNVLAEFGKVDILVNNAGTGYNAGVESFPTEEWLKVMELNINSIFYCCREFGKPMLDAGYGRIINIASMYGLVSNNFSTTSAYHASKGAVVNFTRALAAEWAKRGVTVNAICPGFFASELTGSFIDDNAFLGAVNAYCPMGRVGNPGELNPALIYLASEEASYTTGSMVSVDGGWTAI